MVIYRLFGPGQGWSIEDIKMGVEGHIGQIVALAPHLSS